MPDLNEEFQLAVVGAGPGGLAAAAAASEAGARVLVLDERPEPGGQFLWRMQSNITNRKLGTTEHSHALGFQLLQRFEELPMARRQSARVIAFEGEHQLSVLIGSQVRQINAEKVILSPGAYERLAPFPGWTLPGVMTAGMAQNLIKEDKLEPGKRAIVAGAGPFLWMVARQLAAAGVEIIEVLDATSNRQWTSLLRALPYAWDRAPNELKYRARLQAVGIPMQFARIVTAAEGKNSLREVVSFALDGKGKLRQGSEQRRMADYLAMGYGFVPNTELTRLAGCKHQYRAQRGGWCATVKDNQESSRNGIYIAGEATGIGGAEKAMLEGEIAGLFAAESLNLIEGVESRVSATRSRLKQLCAFAGPMNDCIVNRPIMWELADDKTIVCPCKKVTAGHVRRAVEQGCFTCDAVKQETGAGLGTCRGPLCGPPIAEIIARASGKTAEAAGTFSPRHWHPEQQD